MLAKAVTARPAAYFLTREAMKWFWNQYLPDEAARIEPTASPLQAPLEQLKSLPPALIVTDENDVLRDEGEANAHKLAQAGVDVAAARYLGTIYDFVMLTRPRRRVGRSLKPMPSYARL